MEVIGAIRNIGVLDRIEAARALGEAVVDRKSLEHPLFPGARIRTLLLEISEADESKTMQEFFGPISFVITT